MLNDLIDQITQLVNDGQISATHGANLIALATARLPSRVVQSGDPGVAAPLFSATPCLADAQIAGLPGCRRPSGAEDHRSLEPSDPGTAWSRNRI